MIKKDELTKTAEAKRLSLENAEKDYLLELLLFSIYNNFGETLVLKGGTCMYNLYNLNRFSEDLDFTLNKKRFDLEKFTGKILRQLQLLGIEGRIKDTEKYRNEINVRLSFKGPLYSGRKESLCSISLNISLRERIIKDLKKEFLIPVYREIPSFQVFALDEQEILAEKVRAILTRNKPRDVYDLWFLLKRGVKQDVTLINRKLKVYGKSFSRDVFENAVNEKMAFWETDLRGLIIGDLPDFDRIKSDIIEHFRNNSRMQKK